MRTLRWAAALLLATCGGKVVVDGTGTTSAGTGAVGGVTATTSSTPSTCVKCNVLLHGGSASQSALCPASETYFLNLKACICNAFAASCDAGSCGCALACGDWTDLCGVGAQTVSAGCLSCWQGVDLPCGEQSSACNLDN